MEQSEWTPDWSNGLGFGIPELDAAERRLSALVQELNQAIADGREGNELQGLMSQLLRDARSHFEHEERVLVECAYPQPKGHAALHVQMRAELEHALAELRDAKAQAMRAEYGLLVKQLFVEHMRQEMSKYRTFVRPGSVADSRGA